MSQAEIAQLLDPNNGAAFEMLIQKLMSPSNEERGHAEALFNECKKHPDVTVTHLARLLRGSQSVEARGLAAILLRKVKSRERAGSDDRGTICAAAEGGLAGTALVHSRNFPCSRLSSATA